MTVSNIILGQLKQMKIKFKSISLIRKKDRVHLYRISTEDGFYVLKYFEHEADRREISNYLLLQSLDIRILHLIVYTKEAFLLEDVTYSSEIRLGTNEDFNDPRVDEALAKWYLNFHTKGTNVINNSGIDFYDESDCFTRENINELAYLSQTMSNPIWKLLDTQLPNLIQALAETERTLTYNDLYYTNMIVAKDKSYAFMFDYNLLGKGYVYADLMNAKYYLGEEAKRCFFDSYGQIDETQKLIYEISSPLINLIFAYRRSSFPNWAESSLTQLVDGTLYEKIQKWYTSSN